MPSFFPGDFRSRPSGLTQALSGLFDFIFSFFRCFCSVDRENSSQELYAVTEMRCLLARFWTPKPPSPNPWLLLFHRPQCSTSSCFCYCPAACAQVRDKVSLPIFASMVLQCPPCPPLAIQLSVCLQRARHVPGMVQAHLLHTSALIPFAQIKSPFRSLVPNSWLAPCPQGPLLGSLTCLPFLAVIGPLLKAFLIL